MGPRQLHSHFICRDTHHKRDGRWIENIKRISGSIGVDISGIMHRKMGTQSGAAVFDMEPEVPLFDALNGVMKDLRFLTVTCQKEVIAVFDGRAHPMKGSEESSREQNRKDSIAALNSIYNEDLPGLYDRVKKLRTAIVHRRVDFAMRIADECKKLGIKVIQAPFEADWQLVEAQRAGLIVNILSADGDLFVLGGDRIISELNYHSGACCFYQRDNILTRLSMGQGDYGGELHALSCFLGNDYVDRLDGNGPARVRELMTSFVSMDRQAREQMIQTMSSTRKWKRDDEAYAVDFHEKFWQAYHLHVCPPVIRLHASSDVEPIDLDKPTSYFATLEPLNPIPDEYAREQWGQIIGFGCNPASLLTGGLEPIFRLEVSPSSGMQMHCLDQPLSEHPPHYQIAHGATPADNIPLQYWSDWALSVFLNERGMRIRGRYDRQNSLRIAKRLLSLRESLGPRAPQPREWKADHQTAYDEEEPLCLAQHGEFFHWSSEWDQFVEVIAVIDPLNDEDFFRSFGTGRNGIQERAKRLFTGGHFNVGRLQTANCNIKSNNHPAKAIRMECVPSMKSESYWVMFVIDLATKKFVPAPTSRCGCPAGLGGCSHLRAQYAIFALLKKVIAQREMTSDAFTQKDAVSMLPPAMQNMKKIPIPFSYAFHESNVDVELKQIKRAKATEFRKRSSELNTILTDWCAGGDLPHHAEQNSSDESFCSDESGSYHSEDSDWLSDDDDADEDFENIANEEDEPFDSNEIDDLVELGVSTAQPARDIPLCQFVETIVNDSTLRGNISGSNENDYKMERSKIYKHLRDLLDGKHGPNESCHTKLVQLMQQEAMHRSFESGMNEKCLLSHYLFHTRAQRVVLTAQLKHAIEVNDTKDSLNWVPVRLEKLPPGYDGLGERGFEGTSTSYPHCNPMKTPCFLEGRDQYTHAETVGTRDLCQGRYGSEAYNKRTNDHVYLQDKVPRCRFEFFENALKWSLFKANMCQPFLMPRNAGDYFPANTRHLQRPSKRARADLSILSQPVSQSITRSDDSRPLNYIDVAMPERYYEIGLDRVGLLMDGKDCTTDTIRVSSFISRAQYSDKMHCSAGRYIMWVLGGGLGVTCTPLFLGRVSEKALVEFWGGSTYEMLYD